MARRQLGGFAIVAEVLDTPDAASVDPQINMFYSVPNPVVKGTTLVLFWDAPNVPQVRITAAGGFDTGIIPSQGAGYHSIPDGIQTPTTYTLVALDNNGSPLILNSASITSTVLVSVI